MLVMVLLRARLRFIIELEFAVMEEYIPVIEPAMFVDRLETLVAFREIPAALAVICVETCENEPATALDKLLKEPLKLPIDPYKPVTELAIEVPIEVNDCPTAEFTEV